MQTYRIMVEVTMADDFNGTIADVHKMVDAFLDVGSECAPEPYDQVASVHVIDPPKTTICPRCGSEHLTDRSCLCFDNGSQ